MNGLAKVFLLFNERHRPQRNRRVHRSVLVYPFILLLISPGFGFSAAAGAADQYFLGVFPYLPSRELEAAFSPIAADFAQRIDKPVRFRTASTYGKYIERLTEQKYDITFMQPFDYVYAADNFGYLPLAVRDEPLSAILVVNSDSTASKVMDLRGKTVALPPETAAVSRLAKVMFSKMGMIPDRDIHFLHTRSHGECLQKVLIKAVDSCGSAAPALRFFQKKMGSDMRVIGESVAIPHSLFAVHPRVPQAEREKIQAAILEWQHSDSGRELLSRGALKPFRSIIDSEYDVVRQMMKDENK